jgi:DNA-binding MarR family transcriptional regulator
MSIKQLNEVLEYLDTAPKQITPPYRLLLLILADRANDDMNGVSWPSQPWLAQKLGLSDRYVRRMLDDLEKWGVIHIIHRKNEGKSNHYKLTLGGGTGVPTPRNSRVPTRAELASSYEPLDNHLITLKANPQKISSTQIDQGSLGKHTPGLSKELIAQLKKEKGWV